ncbi:VIT1/CCC1 transporter family protein [Mesorhizobium sp. ASY16-5R]|uniref:VIT1/CCC1 transporter family protein n=1 Tax=Mesorhizobium sp. ASY16-5R TaxID=3445772 RepID=UPI003FA08D0E
MSIQQESSKRVLDPIERISEVLFGLIMILTFTGSLSAAESGQSEVRTMLIGAIGCNLAWGLIDAIMYLLNSLAQRATDIRISLALRRATNTGEAERIIAEVLPPVVLSALRRADVERIRSEVARMPEPSDRARLQKEDWLGAIAVFLLVFVATLPVIVPFMLFSDIGAALRTSNAIAVAMMSCAGYAFGRLAGYRPWVAAGWFVLLGSLLVGLTIALGG